MTADESTRLESGAFVEVRNRFDGAWCPGFQIDRAVADGYIVRRCRDGAVLPEAFALGAVRPPAQPS